MDTNAKIALASLFVTVVAVGVAVLLFYRESWERSTYEAKGLLRQVTSDARTVVANLNSGAALVGIGPYLRAALSRFEDPPTWTLIDQNKALPSVAVNDAWFSSPVAEPMVEAAVSLLRNASALGGALSFVQPAAELLSRMATGNTSPSFIYPPSLCDPAAGRAEIAQGLTGPMDSLAIQLTLPSFRNAFQGKSLDAVLDQKLAINAARAFVESGQHEASLWILRLVEVAASHVDSLPARRVARLRNARSDECDRGGTTNKLTDELKERLTRLGKYEPELAQQLLKHVRRIDLAFDGQG